MSNIRFNTVSTHPSKKKMRYASCARHFLVRTGKITSIVDLCVIAAFFAVGSTSRFENRKITQQVRSLASFLSYVHSPYYTKSASVSARNLRYYPK